MLGFKASKIQIKLWGDRICKDEQLFPLELLHIHDSNSIKIFEIQGLFLNLGN
jgi:hypothetical protein